MNEELNDPFHRGDPAQMDEPASLPVPRSDILTADPVKSLPAEQAGELDIAGLIRHGMDSKLDVTAMQGLFEMAKEMQAMAAARSYSKAFAIFKATCPKIIQRHESDQHKKIVKGKEVSRPYAGLSDICSVVDGPLTENGLSYHWCDATANDGMLTLACTVTHVDGGSRTSSATFPVDSKSGSSPQQKYRSTIKYAQRTTLENVLGLWTTGPDDDCDEPPPPPAADSGEPMSHAQVEELEDLLAKCQDGTKERLLKSYDAPGIYQLNPRDFEHYKSKLRATIKKAEEMAQ